MGNREKGSGQLPPQHQNRQPGLEEKMNPRPDHGYKLRGCERLENRVALITGGDSGIGGAVAVAYAHEGADVAIVYLEEHKDAEKIKEEVESAGRRCLLIPGDIEDEAFCREAVQKTVESFNRIDILVNNAAVQFVQEKIENISTEQLERTFRTNIFSMFFLTKAVLPFMRKGSVIINTTSITAYQGNPNLIDYSSTKGAIVAFTRSLSINLADRGIRVNAVAPGPIWTPLIPATFPEEHVEEFGKNTPMKRPGQPNEVAPCYVFLASEESSYISGQVLHPNGGRVVNG